jgi:hypothetical protein
MLFYGFFRVATLTGFEPIIPRAQDCVKTDLSFREKATKRLGRQFVSLQELRNYSHTSCPKVSENFRALQWRLDCARRFGFKSLFEASPYRKQNSFLAACGEGAGFAGMAKCG